MNATHRVNACGHKILQTIHQDLKCSCGVYRYNAVLYPVTHFVCEMLPEQMRESTRTELFFDDLEKLPSMEVARICEWLTEKVDGFSSKTRAEPKEAEEEVCHSCQQLEYH